MSICWSCHWGWPKAVADIYKTAVTMLDGNSMPLEYGGPSHIVWADENFDRAQHCLDNFDEWAGDLTEKELAAARWSLEELAKLPLVDVDVVPADFDGQHPERYPPPDGVEMVTEKDILAWEKQFYPPLPEHLIDRRKTMSTTFERVKQIVDDLLDGDASAETVLTRDYCDELDRVAVAMAIAEEFDVILSDETVAAWVTVKDIVVTAEQCCAMVEPLGAVARDGKLVTFHDSKDRPAFLQESSKLLWMGKLDMANSSLSFKRAQVSSLVASLQAWLDTGSFSMDEANG